MLRWEIWEQLRRHLCRKFLEHTNGALSKPVAEMNQPQIHGAESPVCQSSPEANQELFVFQKVDSDWKIARYCFSTTNPPRA